MAVRMTTGASGDRQVPASGHHGAHGDGRQRQHGSVDRDQMRHHTSEPGLHRYGRTRLQPPSQTGSQCAGHSHSINQIKSNVTLI